MNGSASDRLSRRYELRLPPDLTSWLDDGVWRQAGWTEFAHALTPEQIIDPEPGTVWGGFMLPDVLPVVGNNYGDWLCLRVSAAGDVSEIVYWSHVGGDFVPYGRTLAEAIVYDMVRALARDQSSDSAVGERAWDCWAQRWCESVPVESLHQLPVPSDALLDAGISTAAVHRDRAERAIDSRLRQLATPELARELNIQWERDVVRWMFDTDDIPEQDRHRLVRHYHHEPADLFRQHWTEIERHALAVTRLRRDLGWAYDLAGWAAERRGDLSAAINLYRIGAQASLFGDESVRFRTHWFSTGLGKFSAARLAENRDRLSSDSPYLNLFFEDDPESLRVRVRDYWMDQAKSALVAKNFRQAYQAFYQAGWDMGLEYVTSYEEILEGLVASASNGDCPALAAVAQLHQANLRT